MGSTEVVELYVYDMTKGFANIFTGGIVDAIYHTGVFVFGEEYSYGSTGIRKSPPRSERFYWQRPDKVKRIGKTSISVGDFKKFVRDLGKGNFKASKYDVLYNNCNKFSQTLCEYLCDEEIPQYILCAQETAAENAVAVVTTRVVGGLFTSSKSS